jgi:hypothetical protein
MRTPDPETAEKESLDAELRERVLAVAPDFVPSGELRRGRKSCLVAGALDGVAAVAKVLLRPEPVWLWSFGREVALYQGFRHAPPPVRAPRLLAADADAGVLVLELLPGQAVAAGRKSTAALAPELRAALVGVVQALARWDAEPVLRELPAPRRGVTSVLRRRLLADPCAPQAWMLDGVARCAQVGVVSEAQAACVRAALLADPETAAGHGDLLPRNLIWDGHTVGVVDWECAGWYAAAWDCALLWTALPALRRELWDALPEDRAARRGFLAAAAFALARELYYVHLFAQRGRERTQMPQALTATLDDLVAQLQAEGAP